VTGDAADATLVEAPPTGPESSGRAPRRVLLTHASPPLSEIGKTLMKVSQNLYAEAVLRTLSLQPGPASVADSKAVVEGTLAEWGIQPGQYFVADGSGLSRHNYVSAHMLVTILRQMARDPANLAAFEATLPVAGTDGTIAGRMKATRAEGNARAKTGTLRSVRALSGYVRSLDGERFVFSIVANNFQSPTSAVDAIVDQVVARLASFTRRR
jgi:D-alanyl-D-alanine carboxypeptidase/D-alanyl-D-alanine-endopeptidase (penicillin-binding protein 4)